MQLQYNIALAKKYQKLYATIRWIYDFFENREGAWTVSQIAEGFQPECIKSSVNNYIKKVLVGMESNGLLVNVGNKWGKWSAGTLAQFTIEEVKFMLSRRGCEQCGSGVVVAPSGGLCFKCKRERRKAQWTKNAKRYKANHKRADNDEEKSEWNGLPD